ncbi:MAG: hypothetical protein JKY51_01170 [Opitutaceae bacterium]|nr:hypothetical protein [Opitutaceae bacterium]
MIEILDIAIAFTEGALLGVFFFVGLWLTVRKLESFQPAALLFLGSMLLRIGIVVLGFYFILDDNWQHLLAGLLGFTLARIMILRLTRRMEQSNQLINKAPSHES